MKIELANMNRQSVQELIDCLVSKQMQEWYEISASDEGIHVERPASVKISYSAGFVIYIEKGYIRIDSPKVFVILEKYFRHMAVVIN